MSKRGNGEPPDFEQRVRGNLFGKGLPTNPGKKLAQPLPGREAGGLLTIGQIIAMIPGGAGALWKKGALAWASSRVS